MKWYKHIVFFLVMTVAAWSAVSLEIQNVDTDAGILDIYMINSEEVGGFQFELLGITITGASTPDGFFMTTSSSLVIGFSLTGATIPVGSAVLTTISFTDYVGGEICFGEDTGSAGSNAISDGNGGYIAAEWGPCFGGDESIPGCMDMDACNYNADATQDDGSCVQPEDNYDCDGNCIVEIDCAGECDGSAEVDTCGVCGGDGSDDQGCGCFEPAPSGCDNECGSTAEVDECGVCGGDGPEIECWDGELVCNESDCSTGIYYTLTLDNHHNLVSFYALPEDVSIAGITSELGDNAISVMAEGEATANFDGVWSGSLTEFSAEKGFWISINNFPDSLSVIGFDMDPDRMYELYEGPNLISFPDSGSADLSSAIPDDVEHLFTAIIAEGNSAFNSDDGWAGSLTGFQGGAGYWVIVQEDLSFSYNTEDLLARSVHSFSEKLPDEAGFTVAQSSRQAFYYVDDIKLDNGGVEDGDWILSYNYDVLAGIRQWKGNTIDIPAMGSAGDMVTAGYFNEGDVPTFKLLKQSTGKIITLEGNIPSWSDNGIFILGELYEKQQIPELFVLNKAYPNPFNPTTTIGFGLPDQSEIIIEIYNLYGKRVETLVDKSMPAGYSSLVWNADKFSSGLYFVKLSAHSLKGIKYTSIQKLMLVK